MENEFAENMYIRSWWIDHRISEETAYFAELSVVRNLVKRGPLNLKKPVTFLVGENGVGKSTLLEAVAVCSGFNPEGGTNNFRFATKETHSGLYHYLKLARRGRQLDGFFSVRRASTMWPPNWIISIPTEQCFQSFMEADLFMNKVTGKAL